MAGTREDIERWYRTLELPAGATAEEARKAYRLLLNVWHPDRFEHSAELRAAAEEKTKAITDAFARLKAEGFPARPARVTPARGTDRARPATEAPHEAPLDGDSWYARGRQDHEKGQLAEAIRAYLEAIKLIPHHPMAWYYLLVASYAQEPKDWKLVWQAYDNVQKLNVVAPWYDVISLKDRLLRRLR